jgi:glycosyltransferase involved in cell wall biosynthesis
MKKKVFIIIPANNESVVIDKVVIESKRFGNVFVVDDGSTDTTAKEAERAGANVLQHSINRGKGAALKTGIEAAKLLGAECVVTLDGDGQHNPKEIEEMLKLLDEGYDVILGSRLIAPKGMPWTRIVANHLGNLFTWLFYGLWVNDSQSGFRAYSKKAIGLIETKTDKYEYDSEIIREIKRHKLKYIEVPITVIYSDYSMGKKQKQGFRNGLKTIIRMFIS